VTVEEKYERLMWPERHMRLRWGNGMYYGLFMLYLSIEIMQEGLSRMRVH
jgi:hypothetical protein